MSKQLLKDGLGWGIGLWLVGYILGIVLFIVVPPSMVGWVIMPVGVVLTLWILVKKIKSNSLRYYILLGVIWTAIAVAFDYFFLVKLFKPVDGYYKLDVYLYYLLTFILPCIVGYRKAK